MKVQYYATMVDLEFVLNSLLFVNCFAGDISNDFLCWDPSSLVWTNLSLNSGDIPSPRENHGFASSDSLLYVFAGERGSEMMDDFYEYNSSLNRWMRIESSEYGPSQRAEHGLASAQGNLYVFGGRDNSGRNHSALSRGLSMIRF